LGKTDQGLAHRTDNNCRQKNHRITRRIEWTLIAKVDGKGSKKQRKSAAGDARIAARDTKRNRGTSYKRLKIRTTHRPPARKKEGLHDSCVKQESEGQQKTVRIEALIANGTKPHTSNKRSREIGWKNLTQTGKKGGS